MRSGRMAARVLTAPVVGTVVGGGMLGGTALAVQRWLQAQARIADVRVRPHVQPAPAVRETYGDPDDPPLVLAMLGDSTAAGVGVLDFDESLGGWLGQAIAARHWYVAVTVAAVNGARADTLQGQVGQVLPVLARFPDRLAVISTGANDVRNRTRAREAARQLADAVRALRAAGAEVVVGTTPDLGILLPVPQPLRRLAGVLSHRLERAQLAATRDAGGVPVPLGSLLSAVFAADPLHFAPDGFHPSAQGYAAVGAQLLPPLLAAL